MLRLLQFPAIYVSFLIQLYIYFTVKDLSDLQELNIVIGTDWGARDVVFEKDMRIKDSINLFNFMGKLLCIFRPLTIDH